MNPIKIHAIKVAAAGAPGTDIPVPQRAADAHWRWANLLWAPHRLGFFLGLVVLSSASLWWTLVQTDRLTSFLHWSFAVSPTLVHASVMVLGFFPLFFGGFLFTAGPKWLNVSAPEARHVLAPLLAQTLGWLLWLVGAQVHTGVALVGLALAALGLCWTTAIFWRMVQRSAAPDQLHARLIALACTIGCLCLLGLLCSLLLDAQDAARACVFSALWGCVMLVFVTVAHRMIPFFTSSAMPLVALWRPFWVLWLMVAMVGAEAASGWLELLPPHSPWGTAWLSLLGVVELLVGATLVWLAVVWGLVQSLKNRLLAMLHIGFVWLGLALLLAGSTRLLSLLLGSQVLPLGALHATTMGCLASLLLAMVTRVSCGHSGRALVADNMLWSLFWALQVATLLRLAASFQSALTPWLLPATALVWLTVMALWSLRLGSWYGRPRADGRPG